MSQSLSLAKGCKICGEPSLASCPGCSIRVCLSMPCYTKHWDNCPPLQAPTCVVCKKAVEGGCPDCWSGVCMTSSCSRKHEETCKVVLRSKWVDVDEVFYLSPEELKEIVPVVPISVDQKQPFALHKGLWHFLEKARCDGVFPVNYMICGLEVRVTLEGMTTFGSKRKPIPLCTKCMDHIRTDLAHGR